MTHDEQRIWMIQYLLSEKDEYSAVQIPDGVQGQKDLLRSPVSYTHLDVYKRQKLYKPIKSRYYPIPTNCVAAVSYTHLDVYKRQAGEYIQA